MIIKYIRQVSDRYVGKPTFDNPFHRQTRFQTFAISIKQV